MTQGLAAQTPDSSGVSGQGGPCSEGRITEVFIDNHSVFDTSDPELDGSFLWLFKLANTLHMDTDRAFLDREILFEEGDCYDPLILEESERILREHRFIAMADVFAVPQPDGGRHVVVDTQDEWTTQLDLGITVDEGLNLEGVELTEENFFGRGILFEFSFKERRERRDYGFTFATPQIWGSRWDAEVGIGRTRVGTFFDEELAYPFVAEVGTIGVRERFSRRESLFAYVAPEGEAFTHVTLPVDEKRFEAAAAFRLGSPGDFLVLGGGVSWRSQIFPVLNDAVEIIHDGEFDSPAPAGDEVVARVAGQAASRTITRINFILGKRNIRFHKRSGLDAVRGVQDVAVGTDVSLTLGKSLTILGEDDTEPSDDVYLRTDLFAGLSRGPWVAAGNIEVEGRRVFDGEASEGLKDVLAQVDALVYWQPRESATHTLFARASYSGGWDLVSPFQLTLGGRSSVRGLSEDDFPGGRRVLLTLEDRIAVDWPAPSLLDLGFTAFLDAGKVWAGDAPFGAGSDFHASAGVGLRIGFPAGTASVIRADLAYPITDPGEGRGFVFRVVIDEFLGLTKGFGDEQFLRGRRSGFDSEFTSVSR